MNDGQGAIIIQPPFTINFNVNRSANAAMNTMEISVYNLGKATRYRIQHDRFDFTNYRTVALEAGYGNQLSLIFLGSIYEAGSSRSGTNIITNISSRSGFYDIRTTKTYQTIAKGATQKQIVKTLLGEFPHIGNQAVIGNAGNTALPRAVTINGSTWSALQSLVSPINPIIDNEKAYVLANNEVLPSTDGIPQIDVTTGLLETPHRDDAMLTVTTLFEPRVQMLQQLNVVSTIEPAYNGTYKVIGVQHTGTISESESGDLRSIFQLLTGGKILTYQTVAAQ